MLDFSKSNEDIIGLNQKLGRLLNDLAKADIEAKYQRGESRARLALPCLMFMLSEMQAPQSHALGTTSEISKDGLCLYSGDALAMDDYVLVFGRKDERIFVAASCKRCDRVEFGLYWAAFNFNRILRPKEIQTLTKSVIAT